jgi:hypothetical protein
MSQDRVQNLLRPALLAQKLYPYKGVLLRRRMPVVVEVVQKPRATILLGKPGRRLALQPQSRRLTNPLGLRTASDG